MQAEHTYRVLDCIDSDSIAESVKNSLVSSRDAAKELAMSNLSALDCGYYYDNQGKRIEIQTAVQHAIENKISISPAYELRKRHAENFSETIVQVANETTLSAARRLTDEGGKPLALNFANGVWVGGGYLKGSLAQEEGLCRSSALYKTLEGDPMYAVHEQYFGHKSSDWAILSQDVPVFRTDLGEPLPEYWLLSFLTCAAPHAPSVGQPDSAILLKQRIHRALSIAQSFGYTELVLGAWGCGAFANSPSQTAKDFKEALEQNYRGAFSKVIFAIADWSPNRQNLAPFRDEMTCLR